MREGQSNYNIMRQTAIEGDQKSKMQPHKSMSHIKPA